MVSISSVMRAAPVLMTVLALLTAGCGRGSDTVADPDQDVGAFCAAVEALDQTDGTTEASIVLDAVDEMRSTAPEAIREDLELLVDTFVVSNYPDAAHSSMEAAPPAQHKSASERVGAYVEERCDLE